MSNDEFDDDYEVGFHKPPTSGQFQKGKSGNSAGRPKGSKNLSTIVLQESRKLVRVQGPDGSSVKTKLEAAVMQLQNKAAQGHLASQREVFALVRLAEERAETGATSQALPEADQKMMQSILRRLKQISNQEEETISKEKDSE